MKAIIPKQPFAKFNICGVEVEVFKIQTKEQSWFCAYAILKNSNVLSDEFLDYPTFREGDKVGVDTAHSFNMEQTMEEKLASALHQIQGVIESWRKAIKE
jgi:spore coat polysaccharide biosynthesis protein SpsF (cytidylyltransferase family)